jgi:hypothetical protein
MENQMPAKVTPPLSTRETADRDRDEARLLQLGIALQHQGLDLLLAELFALVTLLPGKETTLPDASDTEAAFDNLPI